jgi:DNA polymerase-3 subunit gamma/tau
MSPAVERRALYLRWRPGRFAEVLGQEHVTRTLRNAVATGQVAHAYLLCGPRGTGKTSIARILFKALNCAQPQDGDACGRCTACHEVAEGRAIDLIEIDAASNRGIDHIRDLREKVWIAPSTARRKMYILDEAHQLSAPAWDAFLKTLEEPPPHVVFVLATTEAHKVPATILSRCQRFDLGRIALADLVRHLEVVLRAEGVTAEPGVLARVARLAHGGVRDALSTLDQLIAFGGQRLTLAAARAVLGLAPEEVLRAATEALRQRDARAALELVGALVREGVDLRQFLDDLTTHLRALLLARLGAGDALAFEYSAEEQTALQEQAASWEPERLVALLRRLSAVEAKSRAPGQLQVDLELALLDAALGAAPLASPSTRPLAAAPPPAAPQSVVLAAAAPPRTMPPSEPVAPVMGAANGATLSTTSPPPGAAVAPDHPPAALAALRHRWTEVKEAVALQFPKAAISLEAATLARVDGDAVVLAFTSEFHQHAVESDQACCAAIAQLLGEQVGQPLRVRCELAPAQQTQFEGEDWFTAQAIRLFNARGVERVVPPPPAGEER